MKKLIAVALFMLGMAIGASAQTTAPPADPPSTLITVGQTSCGVGGYLNCYAIPLTIGANSGTAWFYSPGNGGHILFRPSLEGSDYMTAAITSFTVNGRNAMGQPTQITVTFTVVADLDVDGDQDTVQGSITLNLAWQPTSRHGWYNVQVMGGGGAQSITQD
jgi:hypothetical protein